MTNTSNKSVLFLGNDIRIQNGRLGKNSVSFSKYLDFCVFVKSIDFKICDVIIGIAT